MSAGTRVPAGRRPAASVQGPHLPRQPRDHPAHQRCAPAFLCWGYRDTVPVIADGMGSVYSETGHGFGLRASDTSPAGKWIERFYEWLGSRGLLE